VFEKQLTSDGTCTAEELENIKTLVNNTLDKEFEGTTIIENLTFY